MAICICACGNKIPTQPYKSTRVTKVEFCQKCRPGQVNRPVMTGRLRIVERMEILRIRLGRK